MEDSPMAQLARHVEWIEGAHLQLLLVGSQRRDQLDLSDDNDRSRGRFGEAGDLRMNRAAAGDQPGGDPNTHPPEATPGSASGPTPESRRRQQFAQADWRQ